MLKRTRQCGGTDQEHCVLTHHAIRQAPSQYEEPNVMRHQKVDSVLLPPDTVLLWPDSFSPISLLQFLIFQCFMRTNCQGPIRTGRGTRRTTQRKQMGPVDVNGGVHTACKQHQRKNIPIWARHVPGPVWIGPQFSCPL